MPALLRKALPTLVVSAVAAFLLLAHLGAPPLDEAEARIGIVSRHILTTGHLLWPLSPKSAQDHRPLSYFLDGWSRDACKPFPCEEPMLTYWQALPLASLAGDVTEAALRLPSAIWALALLLLTYDLARRWFSSRTALFAAGVLATSYGFLHWGRRGSEDMAQAATILSLLWYLAKHEGDRGRGWPYVFGLLVGLAAMFGPFHTLGVLTIALLLLVLSPRTRAAMPPWEAWIAPALLLVGVSIAIPAVASIVHGSWEPFGPFFSEQVLRFWRSLNPRVPRDPEPMARVACCLPWLLLLPFAILHDIQRDRRTGSKAGRVMLLMITMTAWLTIPTITGAMKSRFLLIWYPTEAPRLGPVLPMVSILVGHLLARFGEGSLDCWARRVVTGFGLVAGVMAAVIVGFAVLSSGAMGQPGALLGCLAPLILLAIGGVVATVSAIRKSGEGFLAAAAAVWVAWVVGVVPRDAARSDVRESAARLRSLGRPVATTEDGLGFFFGSPFNNRFQLGFYLNAPTMTHLSDPEVASEWSRANGGVVVFSRSASHKAIGDAWQPVGSGPGWDAFIWQPSEGVLSPTRDPAWLEKHPLRRIKSESLTYVFRADSGPLRLDLGTVTMKLAHEEGKEGRELVITAESSGGVPGYQMRSTITSRLRESDLAQIEADDLRTQPSFKHRRFTWLPEGVNYERFDHCKDPKCRNPKHMVARRDGTKAHCTSKRCTNPEHRAWRLKEAFRAPGARDSWHVIAACYIARGFDLRPGTPPQVIRVVNNDDMWDVALRGAEERAIEVPAGEFQCLRLAFDATPVNKKAKESADEAEGPFGITGHVDLYVDKATKLLVLLDGEIELGITFKVQVMLAKREAEAQP